jgi:uracil DNA glycosylase
LSNAVTILSKKAMLYTTELSLPYSLVNIYKELQDDILGFSIPKHGNLTGWAKQGIYFVQ